MKRYLLVIALAVAFCQSRCSPVHAAPAPADPIAEKLFDPELILQHGETIGLTDEQREFMVAELHQAKNRLSELHQKLQQESEATAALLKTNRVNEAVVLAQFEKLLGQERVLKRTQLALMLTLKNKLTPEQQAKLQEIKKQQAAITAQTGRPPEPHAVLMEKLKKVEAGVQKWVDAGRDPAPVGELMQRFDSLTQQGKFKAAEELIDQALKLLETGEKPKKSEVGADKSIAGSPIFPTNVMTAVALQAELDSWRPAKLSWREIPWRPCLLAGLAEARLQKKPILLWAFINGSPKDERC